MFKLTVFLFNCLFSNAVGQIDDSYSFVRLSQFNDYSNVKFLQFRLDRPVSVARWSIFFRSDENCREKNVDFHFHLQNDAFPLVNLYNDSFPENYISTRHDLIFSKFNQTFPNGTIRIENPRIGFWFAATFVESSTSLKNCVFSLSTKLNVEIRSNPIEIDLNRSLSLVFPSENSSIDVSFSTLIDNFRLITLLNFFNPCRMKIFGRFNGLADEKYFDFVSNCSTNVCSIDFGRFSSLVPIYFRFVAENSTCSGALTVDLIEFFDVDAFQRSMSNNFYEFSYLPSSTLNSSIAIELDGKNRSTYIYKFSLDDRNLGGTIHFDFETEIRAKNSTDVVLRVCLTKFRPEIFDRCEENFRFLFDSNSSISKSLPFPEIGFWFLTLEFQSSNRSANASIFVRTRLSSSACTRDACGEYGFCRILSSQQNFYSTCSCIAGYRGYGCTDDHQSFLWRFLPSVLFLTLSNLLFIPAIIVSIYHRLYIEALVFFFNMFFSTFYHACDQDLFSFCMFKYDGLQLADFIGSYASFIVTLTSMSLIERSIKDFLFVFAILACVAINVRDRFGTIQFIVLISFTFAFTIFTWLYKSIKTRRIHPSWKILLSFLPGFALSITGLVLFVFVETDENYWYVHSLWHIFISTSILFFLPRRRKSSNESTVIPSNSFVNPVAVARIDETSENLYL